MDPFGKYGITLPGVDAVAGLEAMPHLPPLNFRINKVQVLENPYLLPRTYAQIKRGQYETPEIEAGLANIQPGDNILEMGAGAGIVSAIFAKQIQDIRILSFEANPNLIPHIRNLHKQNEICEKISVSNHIVTTEITAPAQVDFAIARNFLGSSLAELNEDAGREIVSVPTVPYVDLSRMFPHNVIVMDIEGAELEFLTGADLDTVELVILEIHPDIYGQKGRRKILSRMRQNGFVLDRRTTSDLVLTFKKPLRMAVEPDLSKISFRYDLNPHEPLAHRILAFDNAVLAKTPGSEGYQIDASVFDADQQRIGQATCWLTKRLPATRARAFPRAGKIKAIPGTWLFGGRFHPHFGHFLCETLSRLWALDHLQEPIDGIIFFATNASDLDVADSWFGNLKQILHFDDDVRLCNAFHRVDRLIVPPQGAGIGRLMSSCPEMRSYIKTRLRRDHKQTGIEKIYISRAGNFGRAGRVFVGEEVLEDLLRKEGYCIFRPEEHSWGDQLAHYLSAKHILAADGSAIHLANYTGRRGLNIGVIKRRNTWDAGQLVTQAELFGIGTAHVFENLDRLWAFSGFRGATFGLVSEVRFGALCQGLKTHGFIGGDANWQDLSDAQLLQHLQGLANEAQMDVRRVSNDKQSMLEFPMCEQEGSPQVFF